MGGFLERLGLLRQPAAGVDRWTFEPHHPVIPFEALGTADQEGYLALLALQSRIN